MVDIAGIIIHLRTQRMKMVQSLVSPGKKSNLLHISLPVTVCKYMYGATAHIHRNKSRQFSPTTITSYHLNSSLTFIIQEQYIFIHDAILEVLTCGDTQIDVCNLRIATQKMNEIDPQTSINEFEKQFKVKL